jgi:hypothetical protein
MMISRHKQSFFNEMVKGQSLQMLSQMPAQAGAQMMGQALTPPPPPEEKKKES